MTITAHSLSTDQTIQALGTEPELEPSELHITTRLGAWCARLNEEAHLGANDWIATVELPGPLTTGA